MCVGGDGVVWMGVAARYEGRSQEELRLVSYTPGEKSTRDHGRVVIGNPNYTKFTDADGKRLPWHHGVERLADGRTVPRYHIMAIATAGEGTVYFTTLYPLTLHVWKEKRRK